MMARDEIRVPIHQDGQAQIRGALDAFAAAGCCRGVTLTVAGSGSVPKCHLGPMGLLLVREYLDTWESSPYWEIILRGGMAGYSLGLHELVEIEWYFENYGKKKLDPYDGRPKKRASGMPSLDQQEGYEEAHPRALLVEHRYLQLRAHEEGENFTLRELVEENPHAGVTAHQDWEMLEGVYGSDIPPKDKETNSANLSRVRAWYERHGFRRPQ
ncbi:MAG: hypothetical protein ABIP48_19655 [Planctomycetota bacterium]